MSMSLQKIARELNVGIEYKTLAMTGYEVFRTVESFARIELSVKFKVFHLSQLDTKQCVNCMLF